MQKKLILTLCCIIASLTSAYETGHNILVNGKLLPPYNASDVPHGWIKEKPNTRGGKATVRMEGNSVNLFFTSKDYVDQIRIKQLVTLKSDKVYEYAYQYRSDIDTDLKADASLVGTGVFLRSWMQVPTKNWTTVKGLFHQPRNVAKDPWLDKPNQVMVLMQNRSRVRLWYRDISLRETNLRPEDLPALQPKLRLHSVTTEDVFILPDSKRKQVNLILLDTDETFFKSFRVEASYFPSKNQEIPCHIKGNRVTIPMEHIATGEHPVIAKLFRKKDNAMVRTTRVNIRRLGKLPKNIDFSKHEIFRTLDGKKLFPIGLYTGAGLYFHGHTPQSFKELGFNVLYTYNTLASKMIDGKLCVDERHRKENLKLLDDAHKAGIWIMAGLPWQYAESSQKNHLLPNWMKTYQQHPALLGWYVEEMRSIKNTPYEIIDKTHEIVKKADNRHPWLAYDKPDPNLKGNMDAIIINLNSQNMVKICKLDLGQQTKIFHCFGQVDYSNPTASSLEYNQYNCVMPIIWGARGIFYFIFTNLWDKRINPQHALLAPRVLNSIKRFSVAAPAVIAEQPLPTWTNRLSLDGTMESAFFALGKKVFLFCGVHADAATSGSLNLPLPANASCLDLLNDQRLAATKALSLKLNPGQARIIQITVDERP